jgi:NitT/TauT family transport system ATP-binding protein
MEILSLVGLAGREDESSLTLSGGEKQRVSLARALAPDPMLLLADEPFNSLDISTRRKIIEQFASIIEKAGKTTVFVTHDLYEALFLADRLIVYSSRPARVKADMKIEEERPRNLSNPGMLELRRVIVDLLDS